LIPVGLTKNDQYMKKILSEKRSLSSQMLKPK